MLDEKLTKISGDENLKKLLEQLPDSMAKGVANVLTNNLDVKVKDVMKDGTAPTISSPARPTTMQT